MNKKGKGVTLNPYCKIGRKKINSMGHIQEEMFWKRFDFADNKPDRIHDANMRDMPNFSTLRRQWTKGKHSPRPPTAQHQNVLHAT
jgi:hypothetical protein